MRTPGKPKVRIDRDVWERGDVWVVSGIETCHQVLARAKNIEAGEEIVAALNTMRGYNK